MTAVRLGIVGAGSMGGAHAVAVRQNADAELVVVCDPDLARARDVARGALAVSDLAEFMSVGLDGVIVATPEAAHREVAMTAIAAGLPTLIEKPLATEVDEARDIAAAALDSGVLVIPGFNLRYDRRHRDLREWVASGRPGRLVSVALRRNRPRDLFRIYQRVHPAFESSSHDVDLALWLTGRRVTTAYAAHRQRAGDTQPFGVWALLTLDDGTVVTIEGVWSVPPAVPVVKADLVEVIGEDGTAHVDVARELTTYWDERGVTERHFPVAVTAQSPYVSIDAEIADFVACIVSGRPSDTASLSDAVHAVEVVDAIIRSARTGRPVDVER